MSQPGQLSHGLPPRDPTTDLARRISDLTRSTLERFGVLVGNVQALSALSSQRGVFSSASVAAGTVRTTSIVFAQPFPTSPVVNVSIEIESTAARVRGWAGNVTQFGFDLFALREDSTGVLLVHWSAGVATQ